MLHVYTYSGKGLALGSKIVVVAGSELHAARHAQIWAIENQVDPTTLELDTKVPFFWPMVVYGWNGDY